MRSKINKFLFFMILISVLSVFFVFLNTKNVTKFKADETKNRNTYEEMTSHIPEGLDESSTYVISDKTKDELPEELRRFNIVDHKVPERATNLDSLGGDNYAVNTPEQFFKLNSFDNPTSKVKLNINIIVAIYGNKNSADYLKAANNNNKGFNAELDCNNHYLISYNINVTANEEDQEFNWDSSMQKHYDGVFFTALKKSSKVKNLNFMVLNGSQACLSMNGGYDFYFGYLTSYLKGEIFNSNFFIAPRYIASYGTSRSNFMGYSRNHTGGIAGAIIGGKFFNNTVVLGNITPYLNYVQGNRNFGGMFGIAFDDGDKIVQISNNLINQITNTKVQNPGYVSEVFRRTRISVGSIVGRFQKENDYNNDYPMSHPENNTGNKVLILKESSNILNDKEKQTPETFIYSKYVGYKTSNINDTLLEPKNNLKAFDFEGEVYADVNSYFDLFRIRQNESGLDFSQLDNKPTKYVNLNDDGNSVIGEIESNSFNNNSNKYYFTQGDLTPLVNVLFSEKTYDNTNTVSNLNIKLKQQFNSAEKTFNEFFGSEYEVNLSDVILESKNAGENIKITTKLDNGKLYSKNRDCYIDFNSLDLRTNITKKSITLNNEVFNYSGKVYDGNTNSNVTVKADKFNELLLSGDNVTLNIVSQSFDQANAGLRSINLNLDLQGEQANNYSVNSPYTIENVNITKKEITLTNSNLEGPNQKSYDGTVDTKYTLKDVEELINANVIISSQTVPNAKLIDENQTATINLELEGEGKDNYNLLTTTLTVDDYKIVKAVINYSFTQGKITKVYDGTVNVEDGKIQVSFNKSEELISDLKIEATFNSKNVLEANKINVTLSFNTEENNTLVELVGENEIEAEITKKEITLTNSNLEGPNQKSYDGTVDTKYTLKDVEELINANVIISSQTVPNAKLIDENQTATINLELEGEGKDNYNLLTTTLTVDDYKIVKAVINYSFTQGKITKVYDGTVNVEDGKIQVSFNKSEELISDLKIEATFNSKNVLEANKINVTLSFNTEENNTLYELIGTNEIEAEITPLNINYTLGHSSREYDGTCDVNININSQDLNTPELKILSAKMDNPDAGLNKNFKVVIGFQDETIDSNNYSFLKERILKIDILKKSITLNNEVFNYSGKVYDGNTNSNVTVKADKFNELLLSGDNVTLNIVSQSFDQANAGLRSINLNLDLQGEQANNYSVNSPYTIENVNITKKSITLNNEVFNYSGKVYDGNTNSNVTVKADKFNELLLSGDNVTLNIVSQSFDQANAGLRSINLNLDLQGEQANNYSVNSPYTIENVNITKKSITLNNEVFNYSGKVYDGNTNSNVTVKADKFNELLLSGDNVTLNIVSQSFDQANAGLRSINLNLDLQGEQANNYSVNSPYTIENVNITKKEITLTNSNLEGPNQKSYDGTVDTKYTLKDVEELINANVIISSQTVPNAKLIDENQTATINLELEGEGKDNYNLLTTTLTVDDYKIVKAVINYSFTQGKITKVYDGTVNVEDGKIQVSFNKSEELISDLKIEATFNSKNVLEANKINVTLSFNTEENNTLVELVGENEIEAEITKKEITLTNSNLEGPNQKSYDGTVDTKYTLKDVEELINANVIISSQTVPNAKLIDENQTATINLELEGEGKDNYNLLTTTLTVDDYKIVKAVINYSFTQGKITKVYDGTVNVEDGKIQVSFNKSEELISDLKIEATFNSKNVLEANKINVTLSFNTEENNTLYELIGTNEIEAEITPLNINYTLGHSSREYDGTCDVNININSQDLNTPELKILSAKMDNPDAGLNKNFKVVIGFQDETIDSNNYSFLKERILKIDILKKSITLNNEVFNYSGKVYDGNTNSNVTVKADKFNELLLSGDNVTLNIVSQSFDQANAGLRSINLNLDLQGEQANNYSVNSPYTIENVNITKKSITLNNEVFNYSGKVYDGNTNSNVTVKADKFNELLLSGDNVTLNIVSQSFDQANAGLRSINLNLDLQGEQANNYSVNSPYTIENVNITKKEITLTNSNLEGPNQKSYDGTVDTKYTLKDVEELINANVIISSQTVPNAKLIDENQTATINLELEGEGKDNYNLLTTTLTVDDYKIVKAVIKIKIGTVKLSRKDFDFFKPENLKKYIKIEENDFVKNNNITVNSFVYDMKLFNDKDFTNKEKIEILNKFKFNNEELNKNAEIMLEDGEDSIKNQLLHDKELDKLDNNNDKVKTEKPFDNKALIPIVITFIVLGLAIVIASIIIKKKKGSK